MAISTDTYLDKCRQLIETALGWGGSATWTNEDFENLSDSIEEKTQVRLSVSTLKRIWGRVKYDSSPTAVTLNTLARFVDYENWREFQQKHKPIEAQPVAEEEKPPVETAIVSLPPPPAKTKRGKMVLVAAALIVVVVISLSLITILRAKKSNVQANVKLVFESHKTSDDLPNSVIFNYNASAFHSNNVYIQQNWDTTRRQKVPGDGRQVTSIYYYPGYFNSKLIVDGEIKKESPVFIQTKGWKGIIELKPVPVYLSAGEIKTNGAMGIATETLVKKIATPVFNNAWVEFTNVRPFEGTSSADFSLETTLRNTSTVEQSLCRKIKVTVLSTLGAIILPLCDKGCIADIGVLTGYGYIDGKDHDLSGFGCNMQNFQHLVCTVKDRRLKVYINNALVLDAPQQKPIGNIIGIRYEFEGTGSVKDVKLASKGKTVYAEKF